MGVQLVTRTSNTRFIPSEVMLVRAADTSGSFSSKYAFPCHMPKMLALLVSTWIAHILSHAKKQLAIHNSQRKIQPVEGDEEEQ